jgi:RNA-directed DNA polymerase
MDPANLLTKWHWIVELARRKPGTVLFSLNHVIDFEWMREAYIRTRKDGATGIDGVTAQDYEANLEANLRDLLERIKSGSYEAPPVRRTYIPKADGSQRAIGIPMRPSYCTLFNSCWDGRYGRSWQPTPAVCDLSRRGL